MNLDPHTIADQAILETDVLIIGAGPAGLFLAQEMLNTQHDVILLEGGGTEEDNATQDLNEGIQEDTDDIYPNIRWAHDRRFGGTSVQWDVKINNRQNAHLATFDPIDFKKRPWLPHSGWPIDYDTIHPYYMRALEKWETGIDSLDLAPWISDERKPLTFKGDELETKLYMTGSKNLLTDGIGSRLRDAKNVRVIMKSNAIELQANEGASKVDTVQVACLDGRRFKIKARFVVLTQGAFQVPRLLLASDKVAQNGLGNDRGLVGRYLMDRQIVKTGTLFPSNPISAYGFYDLQHRGLSHVLGKLAIPASRLEADHIMNTTIVLNAQPGMSKVRVLQRMYGRGTTYRSAGYLSSRKLIHALREKRLPDNLLRHLYNVVAELDDIVYVKIARAPWLKTPFDRDSNGWYAEPNRDKLFNVIDLYQIQEQSPDPDNRIELSHEVDATGMRLPKVTMRWNDFDIQSAIKAQDIVGHAIESSGYGRMRIERRHGIPLVTQMTAHHPAGTARMSDDPGTGVVDADCRVHGVSNLYIGSSAVFPTGGCAPPTLTIVALGMRIADKVKERLANDD
ncbi:MAG: GMC oxidoreductase [Lautropia sp.]|nr:GMC oxidoreductase [Lautropia sp.]